MKFEVIEKSNIVDEFFPCPACGTIISRFDTLEHITGNIHKCKKCLSLLRKVE